MRHAILIAAALALAATTPSLAQKLDAKGKCHGADGKFAKAEVCKGAGAPAHTYRADKKGKCRDEKGKFADQKMCGGSFAIGKSSIGGSDHIGK